MQCKPVTNHRKDLEPSHLETKACDPERKGLSRNEGDSQKSQLVSEAAVHCDEKVG
jgi:hypothetical protein